MPPHHATLPATAALPAFAARLGSMVDASVRPLFQDDAPGAAIIVAIDGQTVFRQGYGLADFATHKPATPDMAFRLGSITKQFTAAAILLLAEQGKLETSDDIRQYLPAFPDKGKRITIEHLLTHTSGIPCYTEQLSYLGNMARDMTVDEMIASFKDMPLEFAPGEQFAYNNSGYFLLGAIIERVSGQTYASFLAQHIFTPLGMRHTAYEGHQRNAVVQASGHSHEEGKFGPAAPLSMTQPYAAGSLVSTVDDLARWDQAISQSRLLQERSWQRAFTPYVLANGNATGYGYGWEITTLRGSTAIEHGGGINGFATHAIRLPEERVFVAVLTNSDDGIADADFVAHKVAAMAIGKPFPEREAIQLSEQALDAMVGTYMVDSKTNRQVIREGKRLYMQQTGGDRHEITPYASDAFFIPNTLVEVRFRKTQGGKVDSMVVTGSGPETPYPLIGAGNP
ncbi:serine hydrolase domain-containing protein [Pseudoduganella sp.]|uniref:serine hydrolase domain-containing protein n=1 Tax=Pseudoduganella sp. TaxID=1880898 RepID=UPI0035B3CB80